MAQKTDFEDANFISSPFVDEVANPGDQRSASRQLRDARAKSQVLKSEAAGLKFIKDNPPKIDVKKTLIGIASDLVTPKAERERQKKLK